MQNPFTFGDVVSGGDFVDRQREISELTQALLSRTNVIIASPRRYGKTSLVLEVFRRINRQGVLTIYVDLFPATSRIRFIEIYAEAISRASRDKLEEAVAFLKEILPTPKIVIKAEGIPGIEIELERTRKDEETLLTSILNAPERLAEKKKKNVAVAFDEFQEIDSLNGEQMQREIRSICFPR
jgi:AAA+ ATPase superfamily predicted ATPase